MTEMEMMSRAGHSLTRKILEAASKITMDPLEFENLLEAYSNNNTLDLLLPCRLP